MRRLGQSRASVGVYCSVSLFAVLRTAAVLIARGYDNGDRQQSQAGTLAFAYAKTYSLTLSHPLGQECDSASLCHSGEHSATGGVADVRDDDV